jgi:uncharacterized membrane protein YraQ (UPF0718 family)
MNFIITIFAEAWHLLIESSVYILFGLVVSGLLRVFLNPGTVVKHLGHGRYRSVFKAALLGIPIPLCSCGVLPAAATLKKQGANNGAVTAFLISTPESGVDSIAITYALLDPIMTVVRPVAAFFTAFVAGISENIFGKEKAVVSQAPDLSCPVDNCCDGNGCLPENHARHHTFFEKMRAGLRYASTEIWADLAPWFFFGLLLAGMITAMVPEDFISLYLGSGLSAMLIMLAIGIPMYICATASTPIAAALILKGVSPGAALVFLLAGPATNITSLTVLTGILGRRATGIYLVSIAISCVGFGLVTDQIYALFNISAKALVEQDSEFIPRYAELAGAFLLILLSIKPVYGKLRSFFKGKKHFGSHTSEITTSGQTQDNGPLEGCSSSN